MKNSYEHVHKTIMDLSRSKRISPYAPMQIRKDFIAKLHFGSKIISVFFGSIEKGGTTHIIDLHPDNATIELKNCDSIGMEYLLRVLPETCRFDNPSGLLIDDTENMQRPMFGVRLIYNKEAIATRVPGIIYRS